MRTSLQITHDECKEVVLIVSMIVTNKFGDNGTS